jgi:hypothetical protein
LEAQKLLHGEPGANENTTLEFSTDVKIEGQPLPAGKYVFLLRMIRMNAP